MTGVRAGWKTSFAALCGGFVVTLRRSTRFPRLPHTPPPDSSTGQYTHYGIDGDGLELMLEGGIGVFLSDHWRVRLGLHLQEIDDRVLDDSDVSLQGITLELHRSF